MKRLSEHDTRQEHDDAADREEDARHEGCVAHPTARCASHRRDEVCIVLVEASLHFVQKTLFLLRERHVLLLTVDIAAGVRARGRAKL